MKKKSDLFKIVFYLNIAIIEFLATTSIKIEVVANIWDKFKHSFAFFVLYILFCLAYKELNSIKKVLLLLLFGLQIEIVQYFLPYRDFSLLDLLADSVGIFFGLLVMQNLVL